MIYLCGSVVFIMACMITEVKVNTVYSEMALTGL